MSLLQQRRRQFAENLLSNPGLPQMSREVPWWSLEAQPQQDMIKRAKNMAGLADPLNWIKGIAEFRDVGTPEGFQAAKRSMPGFDAMIAALPMGSFATIAPIARGWKIGTPLKGGFEAKEVTESLLSGKALGDDAIAAFKKSAKEAGNSDEWVSAAEGKLREYSKTFSTPGHAAVKTTSAVEDFVDDVVMRIGVLNTPALSGERFQRVRKVMEAIQRGDQKVEVSKLGGMPNETVSITIPKDLRGKTVHEFYNVPSTDPALRRPRPEGFDYPIVITGNPHLSNFSRPHPSWDNVITTVRVKPVMAGDAATNNAVASAINYAHEIGAKPLVTTFRSKSLWDLAKHSDVVPADPAHPEFGRFWKVNPEAPPADIRKRPDYSPWLPTESAKNAFKQAGWDSGKNIYGHGGTWWWPRSKELEEGVLSQVKDKKGPIEYCDMLGGGCTSCRNCAKTTYPEVPKVEKSRIMGCTDEPFCGMSCPQCFVRRGQSGVEGRGSINIAPNAKQSGFGQADLGDKFSQSIGLLQGVARNQGAPVNRLATFLHDTPQGQVDTAASLYAGGLLNPNQFNTVLGEIRGAGGRQAALGLGGTGGLSQALSTPAAPPSMSIAPNLPDWIKSMLRVF